MITQYCQVAFECDIRVGYFKFYDSRFAITQSAWHAIHSSNIFQHISSGAANCESSTPFGNQSAVTESYLCISRQRQVVAKWQVASGSAKCQEPSAECGVACLPQGAKSVQLKI